MTQTAAWTSGRLLSTTCGFPVPVRALVVTVGATLTVKTAPADVTVLEAQALSPWLRRQPAMLSVATLHHIYGAAQRESTWTRPQI